MFSPVGLLLAILAYTAGLFAVALHAERRAQALARWTGHPLVHALVLAVYCTTWTYYGSVGNAATQGPLFLAVYLGPTLALLAGSGMMRRVVVLKNAHRITSLADFISSRYGKSQPVAALATVVLLAGVVPYVALQLKAVTGTFELLSGGHDALGVVRPVVAGLMVALTIAFGMRRLDPAERHPGMMVALALESVIKLLAFLAAGAFAVQLAFGGVGSFLDRLGTAALPGAGFNRAANAGDVLTWGTYILLSAAAFALLPRQFQVGVIECPGPRSVRVAMWLLPLYMLLINLFVVPIAMAGAAAAPAGTSPDHYVLALPILAGQRTLSLVAFLGGFSAAVGMVMVETMAMTTMITNHLVLPVMEWTRVLQPLRRHLLPTRWVTAALFVGAGLAFEVTVGNSFMLVSMGILSFAAVLQLGPATLLGLLWRGGSAVGAGAGITAGALVWFYTLIVPTFVRSGWLPQQVLTEGPFHLAWLRPEALLGVRGLPPLVHGVAWSMVANLGAYVVGSVLWEPRDEEERLAEEFLGARVRTRAGAPGGERDLDAQEKRARLVELVSRYFAASHAVACVDECFTAAGASGQDRLTAAEMADVRHHVERILAGTIGAAAAHAALLQADPVTPGEARRLGEVYAQMLADLRVPPAELRQRIDFHREREALLETQAAELHAQMSERDREIGERKKAEAALKRAHDETFRGLIESSPDVIVVLKDGVVVYANAAATRHLEAQPGGLLGRHVSTLVHPDDFGPLEALQPTSWREVRLLANPEPLVVELALLPTVFDAAPATLVLAHDVTEMRALRAQVMQADRLASMGTLAAGVAHEVNNPLAWMLSSLDQARERLDQLVSTTGGAALAPVRDWVLEARDGAVRVERIVRDLRAFTRPVDEPRGRADLRAVLARAVTLSAHEVRHRARLQEDWQDVPEVAADSTQLGQVFLNLIINAAHSIREGAAAENRIVVRTRTSPAGDAVAEVQDTGTGISPEHLKRLFQPYFTTKPAGQGTGLGLFICRRIVESAGGTLEVDSEVGKGSTFRVVLPAAAPERPVPAVAAPGAPRPARRRLKLLICDDEPLVARALARILTGHEVAVVASGQAALARLRERADFDLVFCDLMMPEMTGMDLYRRLAAEQVFDIRRIVFMTGGSFTPDGHEFLSTLPNILLDKPFDDSAVHAALDAVDA